MKTALTTPLIQRINKTAKRPTVPNCQAFLNIGVLHCRHDSQTGVTLLHGRLYFLQNLAAVLFVFFGHHNVHDQVHVVTALHQPKVMKAQLRIVVLQNIRH